MNKVLSLSKEAQKRGIIAASTGNHGLGVARAAQIAGIHATIYVPESASPMKLASIKVLGTDIKLCAGDALQAELMARKYAEQSHFKWTI